MYKKPGFCENPGFLYSTLDELTLFVALMWQKSAVCCINAKGFAPRKRACHYRANIGLAQR
jgi:hypothetical protein